MADSLRNRLDKRNAALKNERAKGWDQAWRDLSDFIEPRAGRFNQQFTNEGQRRDNQIINNKARMALRVLRSGMLSGITSPARPWFKLGTPDTDLMEFGPVKLWLYQAESAMREIFVRSNLYNVLPTTFGDCGMFGTASMFVMPDDNELIRFYPQPLGSYALANSARLQVDTNYREFKMTARQMVQRFGKANCSVTVQNMAESNPEAWVDVVHAIEPNDGRVYGMADNKNMAFRSVYWEKGSDQDKLLSQSGFNQFPAMCPRWDVLGEDTYGTGPGDIAIGDTRGLQLMERRKLEMLEKGIRPPMTAPSSLRNQKASILPGDITYVDVSQGMQGFVPTMTVQPQWFQGLRAELAEHEKRIDDAFFVDLFLMISSLDDVRTATEIAARKEEKMLMLGPVLERLNDELLDPLIDRTFAIMIEQSAPRWAGLLPGKPVLPPPPEELAGLDLKVEYISILAQAQKALGVAAIERTVGFAGNLAGIAPEVLDKLNLDQAIDEYGLNIGVAPTIIRSDDEVAQIRQQRAAAAQQQQAMEQMSSAVQGAKLLSETDVTSPNALTALMGA